MATGADRARLFTAVLPPPEVIEALRAELHRHPRVGGERELRWTTAAQWHLTLGFYGTDDPDARTEWVSTRLAGLPAPTVQLRGSGSFARVLWVGAHGLDRLAEAVRPVDSEREFHAHLTLARGSARAAIARWREFLAGFTGPEWTAAEVVLLRSDPGPGRGSEPRYSPVARFGLDAPGGSGCAGNGTGGADRLDG